MPIHNIIAMPAFNDNYIWTIVHPDNHHCIVVDPGEASSLLQLCQDQSLNLSGILITHKHWDHINGIKGLLNTYSIPVYAPIKDQVPFCDHPIKGGDTITFPELELQFSVMDIPGHTNGHVAYLSQNWVFTGDTLFAGGCGRLFEGTPDQLYHSLQNLAALDPNTHVYCGHEYTEKNLTFAQLVEPNNEALSARLDEVQQKRAQGIPTLPSTIALEQQTNPFLRCQVRTIQERAQEYAGDTLADEVAVFAALRRWKDEF